MTLRRKGFRHLEKLPGCLQIVVSSQARFPTTIHRFQREQHVQVQKGGVLKNCRVGFSRTNGRIRFSRSNSRSRFSRSRFSRSRFSRSHSRIRLSGSRSRIRKHPVRTQEVDVGLILTRKFLKKRKGNDKKTLNSEVSELFL